MIWWSNYRWKQRNPIFEARIKIRCFFLSTVNKSKAEITKAREFREKLETQKKKNHFPSLLFIAREMKYYRPFNDDGISRKFLSILRHIWSTIHRMDIRNWRRLIDLGSMYHATAILFVRIHGSFYIPKRSLLSYVGHSRGKNKSYEWLARDTQCS